jgi:hypothetical protein
MGGGRASILIRPVPETLTFHTDSAAESKPKKIVCDAPENASRDQMTRTDRIVPAGMFRPMLLPDVGPPENAIRSP